MMTMLFACENKPSEMAQSIIPEDTLPETRVIEIEHMYSEVGRLKFKLKAPVMDRYEGEKSYIEFPEGVAVYFYDSLTMVSSQLTAGYGVRYESNHTMEARKNVVIKNIQNGEQLNTEHLVWDERKKIIYSQQFVTITTPDKVLYGDGFESDEAFENWHIIKPKGEFIVESDQ